MKSNRGLQRSRGKPGFIRLRSYFSIRKPVSDFAKQLFSDRLLGVKHMPVPYKLKMPDETADFIRHMHPEIKKKIKPSLEIILSDPHVGKSLKKELTGLKSFGVGRFRIIYRISSKQIIDIVAIGPRSIIYEITYRLLKKETDQKK